MGATMWSSHYAAHHPHSLLGRAMHGASFVAAKLSPASGFGPVLAALQKKPVAHDEVEGIPADPEPAEACVPPLKQNEVANAAPIVIPDDEPEPAAPPRARRPARSRRATRPSRTRASTSRPAARSPARARRPTSRAAARR